MKVESVEKKVREYLEKIKKEDKKINAFLHLNENVVEEARDLDNKKEKKGRLYGYVIGVKSNINVKGMICNCASKTLENYRAGYDATVIRRIREEDGLIIGMTNMDEFAAGSSGENSAFGATQNPAAFGRVPGGSSSGSAAAVAAGFCDIALGSDTGGSIRNPASHCGVVGIKPSYGLISRYGLIDLAMSLDQIGVLAKNVFDAVSLLNIIRGKDDKDSITFDSKEIKLEKVKKINLGVVRLKGVDKRIEELIDKKIREMKGLGWNVKEVEIKHIELAVQTYYPLVYVEFFSATRRFDGRKYGKKIEDVCGKEVLRRIFGGSEITKAEFKGRYYNKALDVKEIIKEEFENVFTRGIDFIVMPTFPILPWKIGEGKRMKPEEIYAADALTIPANLAEICAVSIPVGKIDGIPVGMQVMCGKREEGKMLSIAREIEGLV